MVVRRGVYFLDFNLKFFIKNQNTCFLDFGGDISVGADTITINPLHLQNGPRNLKTDPFLTQKPFSELCSTALMDQDGSFIFRIMTGFPYLHSAKGDFKSSLLNSSEGGFWVRKWSSFRFRGPFCKRSYFIISCPHLFILILKDFSH